jgi:hypothetical protein
MGNLQNAIEPAITEKALIPMTETPPQWRAAGTIYGLTIGPEEGYILSDSEILEPVNDGDAGQNFRNGRLLLRFMPLADGALLHAVYAFKYNGGESLSVNLVYEEQSLILELETGETTNQVSIIVPGQHDDGFISVSIDLVADEHMASARLNLENMTEGLTIRLPGPLSGKGSILLGGPASGEPVADSGELIALKTAIIDEFAVANIPASRMEDLAAF